MKVNVKKLVIASLMLALAMLLPQIFGRIQALGTKFLPMHIPVLLCGFICGVRLGAICGALAPLLCSVIFGMPPMYPMAVAMAFELCAYGASAGVVKYIYKNAKLKRNIVYLYISLVAVMLSGRVVYGVVMIFIMLSKSQGYSFEVFLSSAFLSAIPGIILQLILIPIILSTLSKTKLIEDRYI